MKLNISALLVALVATFSQPSSAATIELFNTGVDSAGAVLADGVIGDAHYKLISTPAATAASTTDIRIITSASGYPIPPYIGDNLFSRWIGPNNDADVNGPVGPYTYRTTFDLTGFDISTASITGGWSTDNNGLDILINGISLGYATDFAQFSIGFSAFSVGSGFVTGLNTLDFVVNNGGGPTALRVEMRGTADLMAVPEPGTLALVAMAALGAGWVRRREVQKTN